MFHAYTCNYFSTTQDTSARRKQLKLQRRLMITMGWHAMFTFVFYVCANVAKSIMVIYVYPGTCFASPYPPLFDLPDGPISTSAWSILNPGLASVQNIAPMLNILLYTYRHRDIRAAILALITCKKNIPSVVVNIAAAAAQENKSPQVFPSQNKNT
jgi:hypothetical protein